MHGPQTTLAALNAEVSDCRRCPRLVEWREQVAAERRAAFRDSAYWGRGVPSFGDPQARLLIVGLAPAAHGANRTGRMFTGDRSGDWLFRALHRAGFANQPESVDTTDGLELHDAYVSAVVHCAPPENKPTPAERENCLSYLERELETMPRLRVLVVLGAFAYQAVLRHFKIRPRPPFAHGAEVSLPSGLTLLCSFHPSQRNTFTGKLTESMLDTVFERAREQCRERTEKRPDS
ncbi:MAG TPA: uracil-DNA glycosylase [Dehalococcoidia bacterium]|nr:uracil-DNA glycosylase [Dehalococcoidia bacterium]